MREVGSSKELFFSNPFLPFVLVWGTWGLGLVSGRHGGGDAEIALDAGRGRFFVGSRLSFFFCLLAPEPRLERATGDQLRKGMSREIASILEIASAPGTANEGERRRRESLWVEDASK